MAGLSRGRDIKEHPAVRAGKSMAAPAMTGGKGGKSSGKMTKAASERAGMTKTMGKMGGEQPRADNGQFRESGFKRG